MVCLQKLAGSPETVAVDPTACLPVCPASHRLEASTVALHEANGLDPATRHKRLILPGTGTDTGINETEKGGGEEKIPLGSSFRVLRLNWRHHEARSRLDGGEKATGWEEDEGGEAEGETAGTGSCGLPVTMAAE